ncbi:MAG: protein translocase subunit SecF [Acidobacteria bacterium]|nr:MAG: protein translocase subunit SecF [Acidobacteriota bacterium]REK12112.1 MAG: protein translocase subunit SecF [Acidobacteriota bacterium]
MDIFRDSNFNFMGWAKVGLVISVIAFVASIVALFGLGKLNIGIDFAGGTELVLRFDELPSLEDVRSLAAEVSGGEPLVQRFGAEEDREILVKTPLVEGSEEGLRERLTARLDERFNSDLAGRFDLNQRGSAALASLLLEADPDGRGALDEEISDEERRVAMAAYYEQVAEAVVAERQRDGLLESWSELDAVEEVTPAVRQLLESETALGSYAVLRTDNVGPQIGAELRAKGLAAVFFSMIGMLVYIWFRFELRFGIGALAATVHDVAIALGAYALAGYEFNLTTVAAFLTVVGYSVNDTVVVFDRVRENLQQSRGGDLKELMNRSLNQTLSRTILTSGTTLLTVTALFVLGGEVIRGFSYVLMVGIIVGTYSSIFVAAPIVLIWDRYFPRKV